MINFGSGFGIDQIHNSQFRIHNDIVLPSERIDKCQQGIHDMFVPERRERFTKTIMNCEL